MASRTAYVELADFIKAKAYELKNEDGLFHKDTSNYCIYVPAEIHSLNSEQMTCLHCLTVFTSIERY